MLLFQDTRMFKAASKRRKSILKNPKPKSITLKSMFLLKLKKMLQLLIKKLKKSPLKFQSFRNN